MGPCHAVSLPTGFEVRRPDEEALEEEADEHQKMTSTYRHHDLVTHAHQVRHEGEGDHDLTLDLPLGRHQEEEALRQETHPEEDAGRRATAATAVVVGLGPGLGLPAEVDTGVEGRGSL